MDVNNRRIGLGREHIDLRVGPSPTITCDLCAQFAHCFAGTWNAHRGQKKNHSHEGALLLEMLREVFLCFMGRLKLFLSLELLGELFSELLWQLCVCVCVRVAHRSRVASDASLTMAFYKCCARVMDEWEIKVWNVKLRFRASTHTQPHMRWREGGWFGMLSVARYQWVGDCFMHMCVCNALFLRFGTMRPCPSNVPCYVRMFFSPQRSTEVKVRNLWAVVSARINVYPCCRRLQAFLYNEASFTWAFQIWGPIWGTVRWDRDLLTEDT